MTAAPSVRARVDHSAICTSFVLTTALSVRARVDYSARTVVVFAAVQFYLSGSGSAITSSSSLPPAVSQSLLVQ